MLLLLSEKATTDWILWTIEVLPQLISLSISMITKNLKKIIIKTKEYSKYLRNFAQQPKQYVLI
jgi:hypothetical protein